VSVVDETTEGLAMKISKVLLLLSAGLAVGVTAASAQDKFPSKPIKVEVPFGAGSATDIVIRIVGDEMRHELGQQIVVENKPGAGSSLAAEYVARSPKDGYTLFVGSSANITNGAINPKLSFDMVKDFAPIALVNSAAVILVANPSVGVSSLKELIELAKKKPGEINYASTGVGTAPHLSGELLNMRAGLKLVHVPYQGSPQAATDLLAGRVQIMFSPASAVVAQVESGKLKVLASATAQRTGVLPNVPTMAEAGMPDFVTSIWFGLMAPAGTPREIVDKLAKVAIEAAKSPEVITAWRPQGIDPMIAGPDQFAKFVGQEVTRWGEVASAAGLKK
jgi:tripartite-type tricarboxylate transporter receptor subunit TctC